MANLASLKEEATQEERINQTSQALQEAEELLAEASVDERVKYPGEGYLDSKVIRASSDQLVKCSYQVNGSADTYDKDALAAHIKENPAQWNFFFPKEIPRLNFIDQSFASTSQPEKGPRTIRQRVERQKLGALKTPDDVVRLEKTDIGSEMVVRMKKFITQTFKKNQSKPISYFHMVLDPHNFSRTVENIYYMSFLVRDSAISVRLDGASGLPFILPGAQDGDDDDGDESQFLVSINKQIWKALVDAFKLTEPLMVINRL